MLIVSFLYFVKEVVKLLIDPHTIGIVGKLKFTLIYNKF